MNSVPNDPNPRPDLLQVARSRLGAQRLTGEPYASAVQAVAGFAAVQAQDFPAAKWALAQRSRGATEADLDALYDAGAILRTHVLRPTWHFVLPDDVRWLQELTAPRVKAQLGHYDRAVEVDGALLARSYAVFEKSLRDRTDQTRSELSAALARSGISTSGQRLGNILMHAELDALIVSGPRRGKQHTYALLAERAPNARRPGRDEALAELTRRYFTSHGPAQVKDFVWWSGLTTADANRGLELAGPAIQRQVVGKDTYWSGVGDDAPASGPVAHFLPNFDEFLVAYRDRSASLQHVGPLAPMRVLSNVVTFEGQIRGFWKLRRGPDLALVEVDLHGSDEANAFDCATSALASYLGVDVRIAACSLPG